MTHDYRSDGEITSAGALEETLAGVLRNAHANGVDVRGGWKFRNGPGVPDWEATVVEMQKQQQH